MEIQKQISDFENSDCGMPFLKEVLADIDLKELIVEGFRSGNLCASELIELNKERLSNGC